jgi:hypothetical protein
MITTGLKNTLPKTIKTIHFDEFYTINCPFCLKQFTAKITKEKQLEEPQREGFQNNTVN